MLALALVATIGYWLGRRSRAGASEEFEQTRRELHHQAVAVELDRIATKIRRSLARHHGRLSRFKQQVGRLERPVRRRLKTSASKPRCCVRPAAGRANCRGLRAALSADGPLVELHRAPLRPLDGREQPTGTGSNPGDAVRPAAPLRHPVQALVMLDIDHFKRVNDELGHLEGDRLLRQFAQLIDDSVRDTDVVARYGGEEFVVILPQTDLAGACTFAERLRHKIEQHFSFTVSGGVAAALDGDAHRFAPGPGRCRPVSRQVGRPELCFPPYGRANRRRRRGFHGLGGSVMGGGGSGFGVRGSVSRG